MYERVWRNKFLTTEATDLDEMVARLKAATVELEQMQADGVRLKGGAADDYALLVTDNEVVALKYNMRVAQETI